MDKKIILCPTMLADVLIKLGISSEVETPEVPAAPSGKVFKVFLDPGHSEKRTGARSKDRTAEEEDLNRLQAETIKRDLEIGGKFQCTIFDPIADDLSEVGKAAKGHDMSVHIHHNCYDGVADPGTEVLYDNDKSEEQSRKFAKLVSAKISKALGTKDRGAKPFSGTVMDVAEQQGTFPVVLTESYFVNPYSKSQAEKRSIIAAKAIAEAIREWFA
jgi:N-acetylmuramoyl-L-alanine amidase